MQKVNLPDGRTLNIPNDLDPAKRDELANAVKSEYNIDINEASLGEWLVDKPISVARGLSQMIPTGVKGIAGLVAGSDSDIVKNLSDYQNYVATESALSSNPKFRGTFGTKLAEGAGSLIGFGGAAFAGRKLASKGIVSDKVGRFGVPGAFAVPMGMGEQVGLLEESRALGEQPNAIAEKLAILTGGVIGMSELAPIERLFRSIPKNALKNPTVQELLTTRLKSAAATGTAEAFQEMFAGVAQDLTAVGLYSDELPIGDSALEEFTIGGILGATADLLINSIGNRRSISSQRLKDAEAKARENRTSLQSEDKFNRAQGQETVEEFQQPIIKEKPDIPVPPIVDVAPPDLDVIQNPDGQFSVIDYNNVEQPIVSSHADETKALLAKNNAQTNYERKVLQVQVDNDAYIIGMPDSDSAKTLGRTILDPNLSQINLSTLIGYDSTLSEDFKKELNEEKSATYPGKPFRQILENKRAKLEKTSKYLESKGLELKSSFSMPEIKKVLNKKDYNDLLTSFANHAFAESEKAGEPSIRADVDQVDVTIKNIKAIADAKNIELDFKNPAVRYAAQQWTGFEDIPKTRNRGAKELFLARIHSLPAFNTKTKFPNFRPRTYTGLDMANFVASAQNIEFSKKDLIEVGPESIKNNQESTDQFFNDLIDSGRAVKVEGKNKYKITDDFEYTVARRQEGFGETPDQFGSRLKADQATGKNKLSDEAIENLIRSEEVRQEKVLPPKQLEAKLIDFKETVEEGRTNKFARELKNKLNKAGLQDVGVVVSDDILSTTTLAETESGEIIFDPRVTRPSTTQGAVEGEYDRDTDIIFLSLNAINPDGTATDEQILQRLDRVMDHEMIHAFRAKDLITEKEYQYLRNQVKSRKVPKEYDESSKGETFYTRSQRINAKMAAEATSRGASKEAIEEQYVEEAIAEMYRAREFKDITPKAETILEKIVEFFKSMGTAMRVSGYADSSEIFADIESGKVGARQRGEVRTLRELDRISIAREQGILGGLDAPPSAVPDDIATEDKPVTPDIEAEFGEGVIITPDTSFEDVQADTDPITGVSLTLGGRQRTGIYDFEKLSPEQKRRDAEDIQAQFPAIGTNQDKSSVELLEWLSRNGPSSAYRTIAKRLLTQQKRIEKNGGIKLYARIVGSGTDRLNLQGHVGRAFAGWGGISYPPFTYEGKRRQQVYLKSNDFGSSYEVVMHELVHQTTQALTTISQFSSNQQLQTFNSDLEKIREVIIEKIEKDSGSKGRYVGRNYKNKQAENTVGFYVVYGASNIDELLAEGLTNKRFQDYMENIPYTPKGKKSLWDKFTESIRKLLNMPAKVDTAFSAFLTQAAIVTDVDAATIKSIYGDSPLDAPPLSSPAFSRQSLQSELSSLQTQLYDAESLENADRRNAGTAKGNRNVKKIQDIRNRIADVEQQIAQPVDPEQLPLFSRSQRFTGEANSSEKIALQKATEAVEEFTRKTPRGEVPLYNLNASDVALKAAYDYINDPSAPTIDELPNYSRIEKEIPDDLKEVVNKGGYVPARTPWYDRFIDEVKDPRTNIRKFFKDTRQNYIDKLDKVEKKILQGSEEFEEVRLANVSADTAAIAALRQADKSRGIFQGMLTRGFAVDTIEGEAALTSTEELEIDTVYNPFIEGNTGVGGLLQITAPLFSDPTIDLEGIFGTYAKLKRVQQFQAEGRQVESPFTQQDLEFINNIEANYPVVVEVYNNYQKWNNKLVDFAQAKGLLNQEQADEWRAKSTYYPFYRDMVEEEGITAPRIGGGSLPNNPLNIKLSGSEKAIDVAPLEAIARNSLSILTAAMKNDGTMKLIRDLETMGEAELLAPNETGGANTIFVFENGFKKYYNIVDPELFHGIRALGGAEVGFITKMLAFPATILRDTVTRDPGFIAVNLLRDTLSATVTSGVNLSAPFSGGDGFVPMVDTIRNMFADMTDLERFGVIGGYDFANDEGDVVDYLARTRRQQGLSNDNGISAQDAFYKLWDGLGGLTTKSDGATRKGVFDAVYKKLKKDGYTEAQAQSEAAYQALEIINFGRRGLSPMFRVITSAIPFLNARIQGLDVIYRSSFGGTYSAQDKLQEGETLDQLKNRIFKRTALRGGMIMASTMLYYLMVSDTDEYKAVDRQVRDDNWLIPTPFDYTIKIPIPFEIGMMFKALPERFIDLVLGEKVLGVKESVEKDPFESIKRQIGQSANIPFLSGDISIQAIKPLFEAVINRNSFTNNEIVPYYKLKREEGYQSSPQTNELARLIGEAINVSPTKIEHVLNGYTGTLGGYVLDIVDSLTRTATGSPFIPNNIFSNPTNFAQYPLIKRLVIDDKKMGGYQQQFYELRGEVDSAVQTLNSLRKQKRFDELAAYKSDVKGLIKVKGKVRAMERYMANWRNRRDRLMRRTDISVMVKADLLEELETEMKIRLAFVPELRKKANVPILQGGL